MGDCACGEVLIFTSSAIFLFFLGAHDRAWSDRCLVSDVRSIQCFGEVGGGGGGAPETFGSEDIRCTIDFRRMKVHFTESLEGFRDE